MHKILVPVKRESGTISNSIMVGSYPETKKVLEASSGKKTLTFNVRFFELEVISASIVEEIENDPTILSDGLRTMIEDMGYKHINVLNPNNGKIIRGSSYLVDDNFINDTDIPLPIKMDMK